MFGMEFTTLIKVISFFTVTSLVAVYLIADGWEMQKLILQQAFVSAALIVSMILYQRRYMEQGKKPANTKKE